MCALHLHAVPFTPGRVPFLRDLFFSSKFWSFFSRGWCSQPDFWQAWKRIEIFTAFLQNHRTVCGGKRKPVAVFYMFGQTTSLGGKKTKERKRCLQANRKANTHAQASCKKKNGCFWWIFCYLLWLQYPAICFDLNISCYIVCLLVPNLSNGFRRGRSKCMLYFLCPMPQICVREIFFFEVCVLRGILRRCWASMSFSSYSSMAFYVFIIICAKFWTMWEHFVGARWSN